MGALLAKAPVERERLASELAELDMICVSPGSEIRQSLFGLVRPHRFRQHGSGLESTQRCAIF